MLSFDYGAELLKGLIDSELKRHVVRLCADEIRGTYEQNLEATEYIGTEGVVAMKRCCVGSRSAGTLITQRTTLSASASGFEPIPLLKGSIFHFDCFLQENQ
jgi:hypothetical protein